MTASADPEPRVREAALGALVEAPPPDVVRAALERVKRDEWWFVRAQAVRVLASAPNGGDVDGALGKALADGSPRVRASAVAALGRRHATSWRDSIRKMVDDDDEDEDVRAQAATALGALCDIGSVDRLTALAQQLAAPSNEATGQQLGFGALVGLAALHPPDLARRLAPLSSPSAPALVRAAAKRALESRPMCK